MNTAEKLCRMYWTAFHKIICKLLSSKGRSNEIKYSPMLSIVLSVQLNWHRRKMFVFPTPNISPSSYSQFVRKYCAWQLRWSVQSVARVPMMPAETQEKKKNTEHGSCYLTAHSPNQPFWCNTELQSCKWWPKKQKDEKLDHILIWQMAWLSWWKLCEFLQRRQQTRYYCMCEASPLFPVKKLGKVLEQHRIF